uniref:Uncharacterized protein n=1 Tax=Arundo donax TaxID=35708 RepID=A0A0A8Y9W8_ARUDO
MKLREVRKLYKFSVHYFFICNNWIETKFSKHYRRGVIGN